MAQYRYATESANYEHYAAGRVFYHRPGATAFPVRLGSEIFQRCAAILQVLDQHGPYRLYDPCCGTGTLLTTLGFLHRDSIAALYGSDIDPESVDVAERNLALLSPDGIQARIAHLEDLIARYGKDSHRDALASAHHLRDLRAEARPIQTESFPADATDLRSVGGVKEIDMVITDVPYGESSFWQARDDGTNPITAMLSGLRPRLMDWGVVAVVTDKRQPFDHPRYTRAERFNLGKRRITLLRLGDD